MRVNNNAGTDMFNSIIRLQYTIKFQIKTKLHSTIVYSSKWQTKLFSKTHTSIKRCWLNSAYHIKTNHQATNKQSKQYQIYTQHVQIISPLG